MDTAVGLRPRAATDYSIVNKVEQFLTNPNAPTSKNIDGSIEKIHDFALDVFQTVNDGKRGVKRVADPEKHLKGCIEGIHKNIDEISGTKLRDFAVGIGGKEGGQGRGEIAKRTLLKADQPMTYRTEHKSKEDGGGLRRYREAITLNCDRSVPELQMDAPITDGRGVVSKSITPGTGGKRNVRFEEGVDADYGIYGGQVVERIIAKGGRADAGLGLRGRFEEEKRIVRPGGNTPVKQYKTSSGGPYRISRYNTKYEEGYSDDDDDVSIQIANSWEASPEPIVEIPESPPPSSAANYRFNDSSFSSGYWRKLALGGSTFTLKRQ